MSYIEVLLIAIGVASDAFAMAICKGLSIKKISLKSILTIGLYFGIFQGIMPLIGYFLGITSENLISKIDHWIAFILLLFIGLNMIRESLSKEKEEVNDKIDFKSMILISIATSIDALAVGITFAYLKVNLLTSILTIVITTFILSSIGVKIGNKFGDKYEQKAKLIGGIILIFIGIKILLEHLNILF